METKRKMSAEKEIRYDESLKNLRKRMKELEIEEKKFREAVIKRSKVNKLARVLN